MFCGQILPISVKPTYKKFVLCITVVSVIYGVSATVSFEELCREIILLDCSQLTVDTDETVCDSNGNSYMNL